MIVLRFHFYRLSSSNNTLIVIVLVINVAKTNGSRIVRLTKITAEKLTIKHRLWSSSNGFPLKMTRDQLTEMDSDLINPRSHNCLPQSLYFRSDITFRFESTLAILLVILCHSFRCSMSNEFTSNSWLAVAWVLHISGKFIELNPFENLSSFS